MFMNKLPIIALFAFGVCTGQPQGQSPEQQAWRHVDSLDRNSLETFVKQFPSGQLAAQANLAIELQDRLATLRSGKSQPQVLIPLGMLGDRWKNWQQRKPGKSVAGYSASPSGALGVFFDPALTGGATAGTDSISFDGGGVPASPTGDGSIIAFRTSGVQYEFLKGIVITTSPGVTVYFGVLADKGLVHLKGAGSVALPDGRKIVLK